MSEPIGPSSINQTYHTEAALLTSRWEPTGLLSGIEDNYLRACTAVLLENQRLMNHMIDRPEDKTLKEMAIKLVAKVFPQLVVHKIASMQPLLGPAGLCYFLRYRYKTKNNEKSDTGFKTLLPVNAKVEGDLPEISLAIESEDIAIESEDIAAKTRTLKTRLEAETDYTNDLNVDVLAQKLVNELNYEHLTDIYNNCGTVAKWDVKTALSNSHKEKMESLYVKFCEISGIVHSKILRGGATFFVVNQDIYDKYKDALTAYNPHKMKIHIVEGWDKPGILMGHRGESFMDSGYYYSPYIPFTATPVVTTDEAGSTQTTSSGLLHRYGKKLLCEGVRHYARLEILDNE